MALYLPSFLYDQNITLFMFLSCFISILIVFILLGTSKRNLNLPPSPPKLPIIGNYHQLGALPHRSFHILSQKYGPLLFLHLGQLPLLLVSSADIAREVMKTHDVVFATRYQTIAAKTILYGCKDIALASYGESWRQKKKLCVLELLTLKKVQSFQFIREEEVEAMVSKIKIGSSNGNCFVNLSEILIATANSIMCRCIFGRKYDDAEDHGGNYKFGELARKVMTQIVEFSVGDIFPLLGWMDFLSGKIKKFKATFGELDSFFEDVIAERKMGRRDSEKKDFLDILLQHQEGGMLDFELTRDDIKALILDMFVGGSDTTSTTLEWAIAELIKNPVTMKKAQEEVRRIVGNKSKLEDNDVNQMSYLKCVVKETLRLHPAAPLLSPRETTSNVKLKGYDIPYKTTVYVNVWAIQRDPEFWERPEEFLPERFESSEVDFKGQDFKFTPFGSGRRKCPGIMFGITAVEYILANILYWFDWKLPRSGELNMSEAYGLTVNKKVPLCLEPIPYSNL